jgi:carbon monoxide dehydrogenase subunit G
VEIKLSIEISRPVEQVFEFLHDFENHHRERNSQVLHVERITSGPSGVGSRYRETVQMLPLVKTVFTTEVSQFEPPRFLQFTWSGGGMEGVLEFSLESTGDRTRLNFREQIQPRGMMKLVGPIIQTSFRNTMADRLEGIKHTLEGSE